MSTATAPRVAPIHHPLPRLTNEWARLWESAGRKVTYLSGTLNHRQNPTSTRDLRSYLPRVKLFPNNKREGKMDPDFIVYLCNPPKPDSQELQPLVKIASLWQVASADGEIWYRGEFAGEVMALIPNPAMNNERSPQWLLGTAPRPAPVTNSTSSPPAASPQPRQQPVSAEMLAAGFDDVPF